MCGFWCSCLDLFSILWNVHNVIDIIYIRGMVTSLYACGVDCNQYLYSYYIFYVIEVSDVNTHD